MIKDDATIEEVQAEIDRLEKYRDENDDRFDQMERFQCYFMIGSLITRLERMKRHEN